MDEDAEPLPSGTYRWIEDERFEAAFTWDRDGGWLKMWLKLTGGERINKCWTYFRPQSGESPDSRNVAENEAMWEGVIPHFTDGDILFFHRTADVVHIGLERGGRTASTSDPPVKFYNFL